MEALSKRENYLRAVRRQSPQWVPMDFGLTPEIETIIVQRIRTTEIAEYFDFDVRICGAVQPEPSRLTNWIEVDSVAEINSLPWQELATPDMYTHMQEAVTTYRSRGYATTAGGANFQEEFAQVLGLERLLLEMAGGTPLAHQLFEKLGEAQIRAAENAARSGADVLGSSGDLGTQGGLLIGPSMFKKYISPIMKAAYDAAKRVNPEIVIFYHSCGNVMDLIELFIEAGVDILDPCQPESLDIFEAKRRYGKDICFHGGIGLQSVMRNGSIVEVRDTVKKTIAYMGDGGGYICAPAHSLLSETPVENVFAFVEAVREFGHY